MGYSAAEERIKDEVATVTMAFLSLLRLSPMNYPSTYWSLLVDTATFSFTAIDDGALVSALRFQLEERGRR